MHVPKGFALIRVYIKGFRRERFRLGGFWPVQDRVYLANTVQISLTVHNRANWYTIFVINVHLPDRVTSNLSSGTDVRFVSEPRTWDSLALF